jgi:Subtilase family/Proprotein convertase P-domain/Plexin repeat
MCGGAQKASGHDARATRFRILRVSPSSSSSLFSTPLPLLVAMAAVSIRSVMLATSRPVHEPPSCHVLTDCSSCLQASTDCSWCPQDGSCVNATSPAPTFVDVFGHCPGGPVKECSGRIGSNRQSNYGSRSGNMDGYTPSPTTGHTDIDKLFGNPTTPTTPERSAGTTTGLAESSTAGVPDGAQVLEDNGPDKLENFFGDPYYAQQRWVFDMIQLGPVWEQGIFGNGVRVRVNDDGVDGDNVEFRGRFDAAASCDDEGGYLARSGRHHGTAVASIVGAASDNGACAVGVAPLVRLSACYALQRNEGFLAAKVDQMDISQNSYEMPACQADDPGGQRRRRAAEAVCPFVRPNANLENGPCAKCDFSSTAVLSDECKEAIVKHCKRHYEDEMEGCTDYLDLIIGGECSYVGLSSVARASIVQGINEGRGGLGIIYVFASGNAYFEGDFTTLKGFTNTRLTISVGAVGKDGKHAHYSTPGASLFISAPGADREDPNKHYAAQVGGGCADAGMGTSFSTPVVSGVISLMLEVNPNLGWRDVQGILAKTATPVLDYVEEENDESATINGAGFWHSNLYGFGLVNAAAAVELSKTWTNYGPEQLIAVDSGLLEYAIFDDPSTATTSSLVVSFADHQPTAVTRQSSDSPVFVVEAVELLLDITHFSRGDLKILLTSPSGTMSTLHPGKLPENMQLGSDEFWKLMTLRNWGETPFGEWKLSITDEKTGHLSDCVDMAGFSFFYGTAEVTCPYLDMYGICMFGGYNEEFFNQGNYEGLKIATDNQGRNMTHACCACGGGFDRTSFQDRLRHWTIAVYGRLSDDPEVFTASPSHSPTELTANDRFTTFSPTVLVSPSQPPTSTTSIHPSSSPSQNPASAPTLSPSTSAPSITPTGTKSAVPSGLPSFTPSLRPSVMHSFPPSSIPTITPSNNPSSKPTKVASKSPTTRPSGKSESPSQNPSQVPIATLSSMPSMLFFNPTSVPTSLKPTLSPVDRKELRSASPSASPSTSIRSAQPTVLDDVDDGSQNSTPMDADGESEVHGIGGNAESLSNKVTNVPAPSPSPAPVLRTWTPSPAAISSSNEITTQMQWPSWMFLSLGFLVASAVLCH